MKNNRKGFIPLLLPIVILFVSVVGITAGVIVSTRGTDYFNKAMERTPIVGIGTSLVPPTGTGQGTDGSHCLPRPACLDSTPPCKLVTPQGGWCPAGETPGTPPVTTGTGMNREPVQSTSSGIFDAIGNFVKNFLPVKIGGPVPDSGQQNQQTDQVTPQQEAPVTGMNTPESATHSAVYCLPRPNCLNSRPPCMIPEPAQGWCPPGTPAPVVNNPQQETPVKVGCTTPPPCITGAGGTQRCLLPTPEGGWCPVAPESGRGQSGSASAGAGMEGRAGIGEATGNITTLSPQPYPTNPGNTHCLPRPACLSANPPCKISEPVGGWCPAGVTPGNQPETTGTGSTIPAVPPVPLNLPDAGSNLANDIRTFISTFLPAPLNLLKSVFRF